VCYSVDPLPEVGIDWAELSMSGRVGAEA